MGDRDDKEEGARVYVGGLSESIKREDLEGEFEKFGALNHVWVAFNPPGFAFIEFNNLSDAENACDNLNGTEFLGSKLRVEIARGRTRRGGGSFRGGQGRGGGGGGGGYGYQGGYQSRDRYDNYGGGGSSRGSYRGSRPSGRYDSYRGGRGRSDSNYGGRDYNSRSYSSNPYQRDRSAGDRGRRYEGGYRSRSPQGGSSRY